MAERRYLRGIGPAWSGRSVVSREITGSNPVCPATAMPLEEAEKARG